MRAVAWGQDIGQCPKWLRRVGRSAQGMQGLVNINKTILAAALYKRKQITLDIDATVIESNKRNAQFTYKKHRGYTPMVGHIGETGQVVAVEFREGNESANKENSEFIQRCQSALPDCVSVSHVRIDAAGYQAAVINHAMDSAMGFAIRAKMDSADILKADWERDTASTDFLQNAELTADAYAVFRRARQTTSWNVRPQSVCRPRRAQYARNMQYIA